MPRPNISQLRRVLTEEDWLWSPQFRITPLKVSEIRRVISEYYAAVDKWIDAVPPTKSQAKLDYEKHRQICRDVLMTYTHAGMRQPFYVRHHRFIEQWLIPRLWRNQYNLWCFAIYWQFDEWYEYILEVYSERQDSLLKSQSRDAALQFEGRLKGIVTSSILEKRLDLLEDMCEVYFDDGEEDFHYRLQLLELWLDLRGIELDVKDAKVRDDIIDHAFNRFRR
jgi:hypothetical protein